MEDELSSSLTAGITALVLCGMEIPGAIAAVGIPVVLLVFSCAVVYGALGETGLSLIWIGVQFVGFTGMGFSLVFLAVAGHMSAVTTVRMMGVEGEAAAVLALTAGAIVSAVMSSVVVALIAQMIREQAEAELKRMSELMALMKGLGFLLDMGISVQILMTWVGIAALTGVRPSTFGFLAAECLRFNMNAYKRRN